MPLAVPGPEASRLIDRAARHLPETGRLGIAYSGGVDSATLLAISRFVLGPERTVGIMAVSASLAARERALARDTAAFIDVRLREVETREQDRAAYRANGTDRCFHCKDELFTRITADVVPDEDLAAIAYGENADDARRNDRPGSQAAREHGVLRPLADAGLRKHDVRFIARSFGLPCADKPAAPCLASRIPHGEDVTPEKLAQVESVELRLYELGFSDSRVRHHGDIARIELPAGELPRAAEPTVAAEIRSAARAAGFRFAALDLAGIQSGALTLAALGTPAPRPGIPPATRKGGGRP